MYMVSLKTCSVFIFTCSRPIFFALCCMSILTTDRAAPKHKIIYFIYVDELEPYNSPMENALKGLSMCMHA